MIWILIGYMFLFIHRPFEVWPVLGTFRIELLYMLFAGVIWLAYPHKRLSGNGINLALAAFALALFVCALVSPWSDWCWVVLDSYWKLLVFYLMLVTAVRDEKDLKRLLLGLLMVMALYMLHSLWEYRNGRCVVRMGIVRMVGVDTTAGDPNAFANSVVLGLIFVPVVWRAYGRSVRVFLVGFLSLSVVCISLTGSRGAFVTLGMWGALAALRSQHRWSLMLAFALAAPLLWGVMPEKLQNRFETIIDPSVGPANAQESADARIIGLELGLKLWQEYPLTGVGPGGWLPATGRKLLSHNLYGQLLGETGSVGALTFVVLLLAMVCNIRRVRQTCRLQPGGDQSFLYSLAGAAGLGIFILLFEGNFGHNLFRYNWLWFGAFLVIARQVQQAKEEQATWDAVWRDEWAEWEEELADTPLETLEAA